MAVKYLLSCSSCQRQIPVESTQAGGSVQCECGTQLDVPALRGLRDLERAEDQPVGRERTWGLRQGVALLGLIVAIPATACAIYLAVISPKYDAERTFLANSDQIDDMSLSTTWIVWKQEMLGRGLAESSHPLDVERRNERRESRLWVGVWTVIAVIGAATTILAMIWKVPAQPAPRRAEGYQPAGGSNR